jgi:hypothetical protein
MKNQKSIILITSIALIISFSSCKKSDDSVSPSGLSSTVQSGNWKVTYYNDSGNDETYHFSGYQFTFASGGSVTAIKSGSSVSGSWSTGNDDSTSKMVLDFGAQVPFDELNDDWKILENSSLKIRLEDVSGGDGSTDYLTFEKV